MNTCKEYKAPEMKLIEISVEDIIQTSGVYPNPTPTPGLDNGGTDGTVNGAGGSGIW